MKTVKVLSFAMVVVGCLATGRSLLAHHGDAAYSTEAIELKGAVVTAYSWRNPHSLIKVRGADATGKTREWTLEMGSTPSMALLGFSRSTMKPGDVIDVWLYPTKNGTPVARMNKIRFADGTQLFDMDPTEPRPARADYKE
jgi:Family of unknown function (DUF6152)